MTASTEKMPTSQQLEHYHQIMEQNEHVIKLRAEYDRKKDASLGAKKAYDEANRDLNDLIMSGPDKQGKLPFQEESTNGNAPATPAAAAEEKQEVVDCEAHPIAEVIGANPKQLEKLAECGIETVGQFEQKRAAGLRESLPGLRVSTIEKWENQVLDWLTENRDAEAFADAAGSEDEEDADDEEEAEEDEEDADDGESATQVRLLRDIPGAADDKHGLRKDATFDVVREIGDRIIVKSLAGEEVVLTSDDFEMVA